MDGEEVLRECQADLIMALARNEATIPLFASALQAKAVIPEAVKMSASNQHTDATARAGAIITSCMSSVKLTPSKFDLIVESLKDVGFKELGDTLVMKMEYTQLLNFELNFQEAIKSIIDIMRGMNGGVQSS